MNPGERVGTGKDAADGQEDDVDQRVFASALMRILEILEVLLKGSRSALAIGCSSLQVIAIPPCHHKSCTELSFPRLRRTATLMRCPWGGAAARAGAMGTPTVILGVEAGPLSAFSPLGDVMRQTRNDDTG